MGSLGGCLKRLSFSKEETAHIRRLASVHRDDGLQAADANLAAVDELIADTERIKQSVLDQLKPTLSPTTYARATNGVATLVHYSRQKGLDEISPTYHVTGQIGAERTRLLQSGKAYLPRSYFYRAGTKIEPRFKGLTKYKVEVPESSLVDLATLTGTPTEREQAAKKAGYKGYYNSESSMPNVVAMFEPVQTASAQPSFGQSSVQPVSREELTSDPLFSPRTWVSQIEKVLEQKMPKSASAAQVKGILSPQNGIKQDELQEMGIDEYLASKDKFDKHNVMEWVKAHQIQPEKVKFSGDGYERAKRELYAAYEEDLLKAETLANEKLRAVDSARQMWEKDPSDAHKTNMQNARTEWIIATDALNALNVEYESDLASLNREDRSTKYDTWVLPGGTNYQEVFVTLPSRGEDRFELDNFIEAMNKKYGTKTENGVTYPAWEESALTREEYETFEGLRDGGGFIIHERSNGLFDVVDPDERVLSTFRTREEANTNRDEFVMWQDQWSDGHEPYADVVNPIVRLRMNDRTTADGKKLLFLEEVQPPNDDNQKLMPKWALKRWREIGLKQALRIAADGEYDAIGWTTGGQQADRYSLRKHLDNLQVERAIGENHFHIRADNAAGDRVLSKYVLDGDLEETVGQELATKIRTDLSPDRVRETGRGWRRQTYRDLDLDIGGEGLMKVYDQDLVNAANGIAKKWGVKVGSSEISPRSNKEHITIEEARWPSRAGIHTLPVTEQMKTVAKEGLPLFSPKPKLKTGDLIAGEVWRSDSGYQHNRNVRASEVLDYEADELKNSDARRARLAIKRIGIDLTQRSARDVVWVTKNKEDAERYGSPDKMDLPEGTRVIIPDDGDGGMLVLLPDQPTFAPKPKQPKPTPTYQVDQPGTLDKVVRILQDKTIDIKRIVEAVKDSGKPVADELNPVLKEEMYMARTAQRTKDFSTDELLPLTNAMRLAKVSLEQLDTYLHARHVINDKVNAHLQSINPDLAGTPEYDKLAGITDAEAKKILTAANAAVMEPLAKRVDAIVEKTRNLMVAYGLEKQDTIDNWRKFYTSYVPLHREGFEDEGHPTGTGRSVRGSTVKERTGSTLGVSNVLANVAQARDQIITRGEKQRPVIAMAGLLMQYPNPEIATLDKPAQIEMTDPVTGLVRTVPGNLTNYTVPMIRRFDPKQGKVVSMPDPTYKGRDNVVNFRVDGEDYAIVFNERNDRAMEAAKAFKELGTAKLTGVMAAIAPYTRYLASINTQYNPIFGIVNFVRDAQFAVLALGSTPLAGKRLSILNNARHSLRGIFQDARAVRKGLHPTSTTAALWERFQHVGGPTGYRDLFFSSTERSEELERMLNPNSWSTVRDPQSLGRRIEETGFMKLLSDYNVTMENAIRLGVFKTAVDQGLSDIQAASLAKNITVNFNKKGQIGAQMGSLYAFFNANVQGTARIVETLFDRQKNGGFTLSAYGKRLIAGGILTGVLQTFALTMAGFGDDDPPEYIKARNLVIPIPGTQKGYGLIPMPLGFNLLPNVGRMAAEAVRAGVEGKDLNVAKRASALVAAMYGTFSPMGGTGGVIQELSPTAIDPLVALESNKDWTGKSIAKEDRSTLDPTPGHTRARDTASAWAMFLSRAINWATGGTDYTPGVMSPTPDAVDYFIEQLTGGIGRELSKSSQVLQSMITGEELPFHKIPLAGRFAGSVSGTTAIRDRFYDNIKEVNLAYREFEGRAKDHKPNAHEFLRLHPTGRLHEAAISVERTIGELKQAKHDLVKKGAPREAIRLREQQITGMMERFNRLVEERKEGAAP